MPCVQEWLGELSESMGRVADRRAALYGAQLAMMSDIQQDWTQADASNTAAFDARFDAMSAAFDAEMPALDAQFNGRAKKQNKTKKEIPDDASIQTLADTLTQEEGRTVTPAEAVGRVRGWAATQEQVAERIRRGIANSAINTLVDRYGIERNTAENIFSTDEEARKGLEEEVAAGFQDYATQNVTLPVIAELAQDIGALPTVIFDTQQNVVGAEFRWTLTADRLLQTGDPQTDEYYQVQAQRRVDLKDPDYVLPPDEVITQMTTRLRVHPGGGVTLTNDSDNGDHYHIDQRAALDTVSRWFGDVMKSRHGRPRLSASSGVLSRRVAARATNTRTVPVNTHVPMDRIRPTLE